MQNNPLLWPTIVVILFGLGIVHVLPVRRRLFQFVVTWLKRKVIVKFWLTTIGCVILALQLPWLGQLNPQLPQIVNQIEMFMAPIIAPIPVEAMWLGIFFVLALLTSLFLGLLDALHGNTPQKGSPVNEIPTTTPGILELRD
jgi:hypothetical protein